MYSWFSHACHDLLLISELFSYRFSAFNFRHRRRRTAGKSVKQQSRVVTIGKKKKLIERKLSKAAPWCPFTLRHCPREPPGKLQDIFFPDNNVKKHKSTHGVSLCCVALGKRYGEAVRFAITLITLCSFLDVKKNK